MAIPRHRVYAHRGIWETKAQQNSMRALTEAVASGFSLETDIRDSCGSLVVSHDPPEGETVKWADFINEVSRSSFLQDIKLAINVKSDGLVQLVKQLTPPLGHFYFDMSLPQTVQYIGNGMPVAHRISEYEDLTPTVSKDVRKIIWLDSFSTDWFIESSTVNSLVDSKTHKEVILVSPELHGRNHLPAWTWVKSKLPEIENLSICTDLPFEFERFTR